MENTILEFITNYGFETTMMAIVINILTAVIKIPIKKLAKKMQDGTSITKYLTFLPIILGFCVVAGYRFLITKKNFSFDGNFISLWMSASSLSLAIYAVFEKFFPSKEKILSEQEIKDNSELIDKIQNVLGSDLPSGTSDSKETQTENADTATAAANKIVLGVVKNKTSTDEK